MTYFHILNSKLISASLYVDGITSSMIGEHRPLSCS